MVLKREVTSPLVGNYRRPESRLANLCLALEWINFPSVIAFDIGRTQPIVLRYSIGILVVLSLDSCGTQLGFLWYSVGILVVLSWDSCCTQLGFLWYSVRIPVVLIGVPVVLIWVPVVLSWVSCGTQLGFLWYSFSSCVCIFSAILNNLPRFVRVTFRCANSNRAPRGE